MITTLKLEPIISLSREQFTQLCQANPKTKLELTAKGELVVMSPTGGESGIRNIELSCQLQLWVKKTQSGLAFDSSTMFQLPSGAFRSPDASWVRKERYLALSLEERQTFPPICPDFIIELRSPSDRLKDLRDKMQEYIDNGAQLGWLIDPIKKVVEIYRANQCPEILQNPTLLDGEKVLLGFRLDLGQIL